MNQSKSIGSILAVDNYRVFVKIDDTLKSVYKSGINDIYDVARINSYLIIPIGSDRVVALITRVTMREEMNLDKMSTTISLPTSARYISATMIGTIVNKGNEESFIQGVYNFPSLGNPVWYVTEKDLNYIFDNKSDSINIVYEKDYYLPIGKSPTFQDYKVKICPDLFFVKHAAILGNTGSGKSCTLTSILRKIFQYKYNDKFLENAHIVIFDTNGEYKDAFLSDDDTKEFDALKQINAYYYGGEEKIKVPYWLMNWSDFKSLLKPSDGTQAPVLNRAIGLAKNEQESIENIVLPWNIQYEITNLFSISPEEIKKKTGSSNYGNWEWKEDNELQKIGEAVKQYHYELGEKIIVLSNKENFNDAAKQQPIRDEINKLYNTYIQENIEKQITSEQNIDLPIWFSYQKLCTRFLDIAISQEGTNNNRISEYVSTLRLRMNSFLNDKRMAIPLMLNNLDEINKEILPQFLSLLLGDYNKCFAENDKDNFIKQYNNDSLKESKTNQVTIVDISQLPFEVLETVTALLGRIILEFVSNFLPEQRGKFPIVIVLEEAQNFIAENKDSVAKTVFERIAREGRKYGISLIVSSQRPSELSKTVLSQCNSFIIHRLQNPDDQKYVRGLVSSANADLLEQLPIIPQQHAIITGDCVRSPVLVRIDDVFPTPNSKNPKYVEKWLNSDSVPYKETCQRWIAFCPEQG